MSPYGLQNDATRHSAAQQTVRHKGNNYRGLVVSGSWFKYLRLHSGSVEGAAERGRTSRALGAKQRGNGAAILLTAQITAVLVLLQQTVQNTALHVFCPRSSPCESHNTQRSVLNNKTASYLQCRSGVFSVNYKLNM
jgi:hypothetical protein